MSPHHAHLLFTLVCLLPLTVHAEPPVSIANAVKTDLKAGMTARAVVLAGALEDSKLAVTAAMAHLKTAKTLDDTALAALEELRFREAHAKEATWLKQQLTTLKRSDRPRALVRLAEAAAAAGARDATTHRNAALKLLKATAAKRPELKGLFARARVLLMRDAFSKLANLPPWSGDDKVLRKQMNDALKQLAEAKKSAEAVIGLGQAGAIVESMCAIASGYHQLADRIRTMPAPKALTGEALGIYKDELHAQAKRVAEGGTAIAVKAVRVASEHYGHEARATPCLLKLDGAAYPGVGPLPLPDSWSPNVVGSTMSRLAARATLALSRSGQGVAPSKVTAALVRLGHWKMAKQRIDSMKGSDRRVARQQHGWAALRAHDYEGAAAVFKKALSLEARDGFSAVGYCLALDGQQKSDEAARCYRALPPNVRELGWDRLTVLAR